MIDKVIAETIKEAKNQLYQDVRKEKNMDENRLETK